MSKLFHANFSRLKKSKVFWCSIIIMVLYSIMVYNSNHIEMVEFGVPILVDDFLFDSLLIIGVVMSVVCSLFVGTEYSDGTIRNKIVTGQSRNSIFFSHFFVCSVMSVICYTISVILICIAGIPTFGVVQMPLSSAVLLFMDGIFLCIAYASIYNLIAMLSSNKAHTAIISVLLSFVLFFFAVYLYDCLGQPEMIEQVQLVDGNMVMEQVQNPHYLTGLHRKLYQFLMDFIPSGQAAQIAEGVAVRPYFMLICSVMIIVITNVVGMIFFDRKDIK